MAFVVVDSDRSTSVVNTFSFSSKFAFAGLGARDVRLRFCEKLEEQIVVEGVNYLIPNFKKLNVNYDVVEQHAVLGGAIYVFVTDSRYIYSI